MHSLRNLGSGLLFLFAVASISGAAAPNIVFIVADDLGWGDVSWNGGVARTPNLDVLRQSGVEMQRYYTRPTCTPTRAALYTGRNPYRYGLTGPIGPQQTGVPQTEYFLPEMMREAGYATQLIGKWHVGESVVAEYPTQRGFDHYFGFLGGSSNYFGTLTNGVRSGWLRDESSVVTDTGYSTDLFAAEAEVVLRNRDKSKPLFMMVCFNAPHTPLEAPPEIEATYPQLTGDLRTYAAMIESLDTAVGRILTELEVQGMSDDTLVVFVSDNGAALNQSPGSNGPLRSGKGFVYEGGIRVPALARWPGVLPAGLVVDQVIADLDWLPTLGAASGVSIGTDAPIDGVAQWRVLQKLENASERELVVAGASTSTFIAGSSKIVLNRNGQFELFDLQSDPGEAGDLSSSNPDLARVMQANYERALARLRADFFSSPGVALINISARARVGGVAEVPVSGFVVEGAIPSSLLVRAIGPTLFDFGVVDFLAEPSFEVVSGQNPLAQIVGWQSADAEAMASVGAFSLREGSADSVWVGSLGSGAYTAPVRSVSGAVGVALLEVYDANRGAVDARLLNVSTRAYVGTGEDLLIAGFVLSGEGAARVLIRAIGPGLADFGVPGTLVDPVINLYRSGSLIATNDNWSVDAALMEDAAVASGAFALKTDSRDAGLLVTLQPGHYTANVTGAGEGVGAALIEVYIAPTP